MAKGKGKAKAKAKGAATKAKGKKKKAKTACKTCKMTCKELYEKHQKELEKAKAKELGPKQQADLDKFKKNYEANKSRYEAVGKEADMPPELVASLHWRESSGNFGKYLHQGDPLGAPAKHVPTNIPVFGKDEWDKAAVHALKMKQMCKKELGINKDTKDRAKLAAFSERYNGMGYNNKGVASPYVYSGMDTYTSGKYVADGVYSASTVDQQLGVVRLSDSISGQ
jgi:lysozyme family protein